MKKTVKLSSVPLKLHTENVNFSEDSETIVKKNYYTLTKSSSFFLDGKNVEKIHCINDKTFVYCNDQKIYQLTSQGKTIVLSQEFSDLRVEYTVCDGEFRYIFFDGEKVGFIDPERIFLTDQFNKISCSLQKITYFAEGNKIYIRENYKTSDGVLQYDQEVCYLDEFGSGEILGLCALNDEIIVLRKNDMFTLNLKNEPRDIVIKKISTPYFSAKERSLSSCGNKAVFVCEKGRVCIFDGKSLSFYDTFSKFNIDDIIGDAKSSGGEYLIQTSVNGKGKVVVFDLEGKTFHALQGDYDKVSVNGGYFINEQGEILKLCKMTATESITTTAQTVFDLGCCEKKVIYKITLNAKGNGIMRVSGDFTTKEFQINEGCNEIYCNLSSREFAFEFNGVSPDFYTAKAKITFIKIGG